MFPGKGYLFQAKDIQKGRVMEKSKKNISRCLKGSNCIPPGRRMGGLFHTLYYNGFVTAGSS